MGEIEEQNDFKHKINFLNLIKTQIPSDEQSNLTANPIVVKIWLQFTQIEVNLCGLFLGGRSAFKGKIRSNPTINHDKSCLNWISIKSKCRRIVMN